MRPRIKATGERLASTRSSTTVESTTFYAKAHHLHRIICKNLTNMGFKSKIVVIKAIK